MKANIGLSDRIELETYDESEQKNLNSSINLSHLIFLANNHQEFLQALAQSRQVTIKKKLPLRKLAQEIGVPKSTLHAWTKPSGFGEGAARKVIESLGLTAPSIERILLMAKLSSAKSCEEYEELWALLEIQQTKFFKTSIGPLFFQKAGSLRIMLVKEAVKWCNPPSISEIAKKIQMREGDVEYFLKILEGEEIIGCNPDGTYYVKRQYIEADFSGYSTAKIQDVMTRFYRASFNLLADRALIARRPERIIVNAVLNINDDNIEEYRNDIFAFFEQLALKYGSKKGLGKIHGLGFISVPFNE